MDNNNIDYFVSQQAIEVSIGILMALAAITYLAVGISIYLTLMLYWEIFIVSNL